MEENKDTIVLDNWVREWIVARATAESWGYQTMDITGSTTYAESHSSIV